MAAAGTAPAGLYCEFRRAWCPVAGYTDAPVSWPYTAWGRGGPSLIVCGALADEARSRPAGEVAFRYGVSPQTARRWRLALAGRRQLARRRWSPEEIAAAVGCPPARIADVAAALGRTAKEVHLARYRHKGRA